MADNAKRTCDLPIANSANTSDRLLILQNANSATSNTTATITVQNFFSNSVGVPCAVINSPSNSIALTITGGSIYTDGNFLYVAVSNNVLKRVALSSF
jgi:hypothetical protein